MKITRRQLRRLIESYNSMSPRSKSLANSIKRKFMKMYPDAKVGIDGREGWITVNGQKAVNMSQASGGPLSDEEMIDQMHAVYAGNQVDSDVSTADSRMNTYREGKAMKITKRQLRQMIRGGILKESPMPLKSLASPEFAAAIKGRKINEVVASDTAEDLKDELSGLRDTMQEVRDYCERGNMDFDTDAQTRVAANMDQILDIMEEVMGILNDEIASEEKI